eukprot:COSAG05_NODE_1296_length_5247_cov_2.705517_4_plen_79_part_00
MHDSSGLFSRWILCRQSAVLHAVNVEIGAGRYGTHLMSYSTAVSDMRRLADEVDELMVYSKSLELKESKYEASLVKTL